MIAFFIAVLSRCVHLSLMLKLCFKTFHGWQASIYLLEIAMLLLSYNCRQLKTHCAWARRRGGSDIDRITCMSRYRQCLSIILSSTVFKCAEQFNKFYLTVIRQNIFGTSLYVLNNYKQIDGVHNSLRMLVLKLWRKCLNCIYSALNLFAKA